MSIVFKYFLTHLAPAKKVGIIFTSGVRLSVKQKRAKTKSGDNATWGLMGHEIRKVLFESILPKYLLVDYLKRSFCEWKNKTGAKEMIP